MDRLIECVPNFSEGRDKDTLEKISEAIKSVDGVRLLHVDVGYGANRTVFTFVGEPERVVEAAFSAVKVAAQNIDMRTHKGAHPRIGAADVVPFIPISGVTMQEVICLAKAFSERVAHEIGIPIYCYEKAAASKDRESLAACRAGEYEGIKDKIADESWKPDYGQTLYNETVAKCGISVVGAREFLVAVNFSLATKDVQVAREIAEIVRESGSITNGKRTKGTLKAVKAIGWYIPEYGFAQVSVNITDINIAPLYKVWQEVCSRAIECGTKVIGVEIIGLLPKKVLLDAGLSITEKPLPDIELMQKAVDTMNLSHIEKFEIHRRVIEYINN